MADLLVEPSPFFRGETTVPGDKSISHRALILGAIAENTIDISGFLTSEDCLATLATLQKLGVNIQLHEDKVTLEGVGLSGLRAPSQALDCGNAGTSMRLLAGLLAAQPFASTLVGDESLSRRPMDRIIAPLTQMGARLKGYPPLHIEGNPHLQGIEYRLPVASAQVKSCLMLAALYAKTTTTLIEPEPTRDHTERLLLHWGYPLQVAGQKITIPPGKSLYSKSLKIPGDFSSAAFLIGGVCIHPKGQALIKNVGINPSRVGMIHILRAMGADIKVTAREGYEPFADIEVRGQPLKGIEVPASLVASSIDEFPMLFVIAACAQGETIFRGLAELRVKESDRLTTMAKGLASLGVSVKVFEDGLCITGSPILGGEIDSLGDHRIAMAFAMAGLVTKDTIKIKQCDNIKTSFPNFCEIVQNLGSRIHSC